jgi:hypothetical protein
MAFWEPKNGVLVEWSLALIGNASGKEFSGRRERTPEAFSIRRLGGSRWRLRQMRGYGIEWAFAL